MNMHPTVRSAVAAALLLGTAGVAYPWSVWLKSGILSGSFLGYYYGAAYTTIHSFNPLLLDGGAPARIATETGGQPGSGARN